MTTEFRIVRSLLHLFKSHRLAVAASVVLGILSSFAEGVGLALFIPFIQIVTTTGPSVANDAPALIRFLEAIFAGVPKGERMVIICAGILGAILAKVVLYYLHGLLLMYLDWKIGHQIRSGLANQLLSVSFRYVEQRDSGDLLNTLSTESWNATDALSVILDLIITACTLLVYFVLLLLISPKLTLLALVAMLFISLTVRFLTRHVNALGTKVRQENARLATRMLETVEGNKVIRTFGRESYEQTRFDDISQRLGRLCCQLGSVRALVSPVYELSCAALLVSVLFTSTQDPTSLGSALVFMFALYRVQPKMADFDGARVSLRSHAASIDAVTSLLTSADKPYLESGTMPFVGVTHEISFDRAAFKYNADDSFAIRDLCLRFEACKTTALVGPSGSGKSTLIKLLLRLYDLDAGEIRVDGLPLRTLDLPSWREKIAVVSQDVYVFNATIRDNIAYGRLDASDAEVIAAAKKANAHDFIAELPQGYLTPVGDRGLRLSGGQLQRLTLARAIVRDPDILILDEATNSLDSISEHLIQEALETFAKSRTVIIIAHRFSTIEQADHIIVLEEGRIREQGPLDALLNQGGLFSQLYAFQHPAPRTVLK
jgi:subfamily B ATP-binding cassette protein MsbA